jgi:nitroreductase
MDLWEAITQRRSVRQFTDQAVEQDQLDRIIQAGTWAPSPLHQQPWCFLVIDDPEVKAKVLKVGQKAGQSVLEGGGPDWVKKYDFSLLGSAPVLIAVFYNPAKGGLGGYFEQPLGAHDAACAAIQNMMLTTHSLGLGTVWFTFYDPKEMCAALGAPEGWEMAGILPLGQPAGEVKAPPRKEPKVYTNSFNS